MAALLSIRMGSQEKVAQYVNETRRLGIKVLPPDINESFSDFTIVENSVRFGLSAIKNVGSNVIELIVKERKENGRFSSFLNFCSRVSSNVLNKKTIESLIKSGTFDSLKQPRKYLLENFENIIEEINKVKKSKESGQFSLFEEEHSSHNQEFEHFYEEYSQKKLLNFEKEMLGLYVSGHPLAEFQDYLSDLNTIENLYEEPDKSTQLVGGVISKLKQIFTKSGQPMYFLTLEDLTDNVEVIVFPTVLEKYKELVEEDKIIIVKGRLDRKEDQIKLIAIEIKDINRPESKKSVEFTDRTEGQVSEVEKENSFKSGQLERIVLRVDKANLDKNLINNLHEIMKSNSGSSRVELKIINGDGSSIEKTFSFPEGYSVKPSEEFFNKLKEYFQDKIIWR
jgi:DNA polymerase-3 subunit alpha